MTIGDYTLDIDDELTDDYPTRCACRRPIERFSVFPGSRCIHCHAASTPPLRADQADVLIRMWS